MERFHLTFNWRSFTIKKNFIKKRRPKIRDKMCIDCNKLWKGIFYVGLFISLLIIMELRKVLVESKNLVSPKDNKFPRMERTVDPWTDTRTCERLQYSIFQLRQEIGSQFKTLNSFYIELSNALISRSTEDEILAAQIETIQNQIDLIRDLLALRNIENG